MLALLRNIGPLRLGRHYSSEATCESTLFLSDVEVSSREYKNYKLKAVKVLTNNTSIFTFDYPETYSVPLGHHLSARAQIDGQNVMKPYTPITPNYATGSIDLLVKVYPQGKMSKHIGTLKVGDELALMGPIGHFRYSPEDLSRLDSIAMIAGGTGITPVYQILQYLMGLPRGKTKIMLIYANESYEDILLREELETWAKNNPQRLEIVFLLKKVPPGLSSSGPIYYEAGRISPKIFMNYAHTNVCAMEEAAQAMMQDIGIPSSSIVCFTQSDVKPEPTGEELPSARGECNIKQYNLEEVARHNTEKDCWMTIKGKVYDVTKYIDTHPGGDIILEGAGVDATRLFHVDCPHSQEAEEILETFCIGTLKKE